MKTVLLAGGLGTRLREETEFRPKPMVNVGNMPILWHIMKIFESFNFTDFIICSGYKSEIIENFFDKNLYTFNESIPSYKFENLLDFKMGKIEDWSVFINNTGNDTMTGGRIKKIEKFIDNERFFCTYGDGLANVNLQNLLSHHISSKKLATVTAVHPTSRFGHLRISSNGTVSEFSEKPLSEDWINGGFFVFEKKIFEYLSEDSVLEKDVLPMLAEMGQLSAYMHEGFWQPMDTYREFLLLNQLWSDGVAPWKNW